VLPLGLTPPPGRPLSVLAVGAHPDDIEIGAGGLLLSLARAQPELSLRYLVLTGTPARHDEARAAVAAFAPGAGLSISLHDLPEGRLPANWAQAKDLIEAEARHAVPDLVLAPSPDDAHQDHRTVGEIVPTVFRDALYLGYEIPKWDGDLGRPAVYIPATRAQMARKIELLERHFGTQRSKDWFTPDTFEGLARLRGIECRAADGVAEAFHSPKLALS